MKCFSLLLLLFLSAEFALPRSIKRTYNIELYENIERNPRDLLMTFEIDSNLHACIPFPESVTDRVSSIYVPTHGCIELYDQIGCQGNSVKIMWSEKNKDLSHSHYKFNDMASSVRVCKNFDVSTNTELIERENEAIKNMT